MTYRQPQPMWQPPIRTRPHGAWYIAPAATVGLSAMCLVAAGVVWMGVRARKSLRDTTTYGDGSQVPSYPWNDHQGTVNLWLIMAAVTATLAVAGFVGLATVRGRNRREAARLGPAPYRG
ncbi:hypothetical protein [Embleya sp. NBC_00896]|uniref:hypothetical protein n=1 Tax=Embleya sp. NBC_00896 TaxID=2975961 RepID=UPI002F9178BB|nr:hypothetical protein OG928_37640 [Embleya sp. NBC_00896]